MKYLNSLDYVTPDLVRVRTLFANLYFYKSNREFVIIDAGLPGFGKSVLRALESIAAEREPDAVILTHGHFDHVGALPAILKRWPDITVYANSLEFPYLTGQEKYPPADPWNGTGAMAMMSFLYPRKPIDISSNLQPLPADGSIPFMSGWHWVPTPGHTRGHVSLFRPDDRTVIAGDAFVTVRQESLAQVSRQTVEVNGPPAYFTPDWTASEHSVQTLLSLKPLLALTGHGKPLRGKMLTEGLSRLAHSFAQTAVPKRGRYAGNYIHAEDSQERTRLAREKGGWQKFIKHRLPKAGNDYAPDPSAAPLGTDQEAGGPISTPQGNIRQS